MLAHNRRGDALRNFSQRIALAENQTVRVAVGIDKAGREHESTGVEDHVTLRSVDIAYCCNAVALESHATPHRGRTGAIDNARVGNQRIGE